MEIKCPKCGKMLASKEEMIEHQKTHMSGNEQNKVRPADLTEIRKIKK